MELQVRQMACRASYDSSQQPGFHNQANTRTLFFILFFTYNRLRLLKTVVVKKKKKNLPKNYQALQG